MRIVFLLLVFLLSLAGSWSLLYFPRVDTSALMEPEQRESWFMPDEVNNRLLPATASSFLAWGDANGDGHADLWSGNHGQPRLFINRGGELQDQTRKWELAGRRDTHGAVWGDYDNDGRQDLLELVGAARGLGADGGPRLHHNLGARFVNVAPTIGLSLPLLRGRVPLWFDVDADNQPDALLLAVARAEQGPNLYRQSNGRFEAASPDYGFTGVEHAEYAQLAYVAPGDLRLVVHNRFYPGATFRLVDERLQVAENPLPARIGDVTDSLWADFNNDQVDDLLVVQNLRASASRQVAERRLAVHLVKPHNISRAALEFQGPPELRVSVYPRSDVWWNASVVYLNGRLLNPSELVSGAGRHGLHFTASADAMAASASIVERPRRHLALDYDAATGSWTLSIFGAGDDDVNALISAQAAVKPLALLPEPPQRVIRPRLFLSSAQGLRRAPLPVKQRLCSGASAGDFDNDGDLDVLLVCGSELNNGPDQVLENEGNGVFRRRSQQSLTRVDGAPDAAAVADYNRDGMLDLVISNGQGKHPFNRGPLQFFRGVDQGNNWLQVDVTPPPDKAYPWGAQLLVSVGGKLQARTVGGNIHRGAQDDQILHFGIGQQRQIDWLELRWPDGSRRRLTDVAINSRIAIPAHFYE